MNDLHYRINIIWSDEDNLFLAELPDFQEGYWADGETYEACLAMAKEVLAVFIQDRKERNLPIPEPLTKDKVKAS
jgi:antitoxin HicB